MFFDRFWWGKKIQGISLYFDTHAFFYTHLFFFHAHLFLNPQNSENRIIEKSEVLISGNQEFGKSEREKRKVGKLKIRKIGNSEIGNSEIGNF